jgi:hypothetical protein
MRHFCKLSIARSAAAFVCATALSGSSLPALTPQLWDLTYGSNDTFTSTTGGTGATLLAGNTVLLYGTATSASGQRVLEFDPFTSADVCYSTTCPSSTGQYPQPNFVFNIGSFVFDPYSIVSGTSISSAAVSLSFFGDLTFLGSSQTFPSGTGSPTLFTGEDPGGTTSYVYFVNADGTTTSVLHVTDGTVGSVFLTGVLIDPPATVTFDILGFTNLGPNEFVTTPEPGSFVLVALAGVVLICIGRKRVV